MSNNAADVLALLANPEALENLKTTYPEIEPGVYEWSIKAMEQRTSDSGFEYINVQLSLVSTTARDLNGVALNPGYTMSHMLALSTTDKAIEERGEEEAKAQTAARIAAFLDAFQKNRYWDATFADYIGKRLFAKVSMSKERTDKKTGVVYDARPEIKSFIKLS